MSEVNELIAIQAMIYRQTRKCRGKLPSLMTWLVDRRNLLAATNRVVNSEGANTPGPDGVVRTGVLRDLQGWVSRLSEELFHRRYRPVAPRVVTIDKEDAGIRTLGVLTLKDRVIHAAIKNVLEPVLEPTFAPSSFGYRPGRSVPGALDQALQLLSGRRPGAVPFPWALSLDVVDCFPSIDHRILTTNLQRVVGDGEFLRLVEQVVEAGRFEERRGWFRRRAGLIQGSGLSPMLSNFYLSALDQELHAHGSRQQQATRVLRYADDLLVLARTRRSGRQAERVARAAARRLRLRLRRRGPTRISDGIEWLGVRIQPRKRFWAGAQSFGYVVPEAKVLKMMDRITDMTTPPSSRLDASAVRLDRWIVSLNEQYRSWREAYLYADNAPHVFRALDEYTNQRVLALLQSVTGLRRSAVYRRYRSRLARGFRTWEVDGCRLVVLSALAPRSPYALTRRPAWMQLARRPESPLRRGEAVPQVRPEAAETAVEG
jgi:group II intron reverse transcriptase/maturase